MGDCGMGFRADSCCRLGELAGLSFSSMTPSAPQLNVACLPKLFRFGVYWQMPGNIGRLGLCIGLCFTPVEFATRVR